MDSLKGIGLACKGMTSMARLPTKTQDRRSTGLNFKPFPGSGKMTRAGSFHIAYEDNKRGDQIEHGTVALFKGEKQMAAM